MPGDTTSLDVAALLRQTDWLHALARGLVGDRERADDVLQSTLVEALERPPRGGGDERVLRAWLARVARSAASVHGRSEARRRRREERVARAETAADSVAESVERAALQRELLAAVLELEPPFRDALVLRYFDGLPPREIARSLGESGAAVRTRLSRALEQLRGRLDAQHGGERARWARALVPFAAAPRATALAAFGPLASVGKFTAAAACAVIVAALLYHLSSPRGAEPTPLAPGAPDALADLRADGEEAPLPAEGPERVAMAAGPELDAEDAARGAARGEALVLEASFVDTEGSPLEGVALLAIGPADVAGGPADVAGGPADAAGGPADVAGGVHGVSDAAGAVTLRLGAATRNTGTLVLSARRADLAWRAIEVALDDAEPGEPLFLGRLVMLAGGAVSGRVLHADGRPAEGAEVYAGTPGDADTASGREHLHVWGRWPESLGDGLRSRTRAAADGSFLLEGVPASRVTVFARGVGTWHAFCADVEVRAGGTVYVPDLILEPPPTANRIAGRVLTAEGDPVADAPVYLTTEGGGGVFPGRTHTDADGRFLLIAGRNQDFAVVAEDPERRWPRIDRTPVRAGVTDLELRFLPDRWIEVVCTGPDGEPVTAPDVWTMTPERRGLRTERRPLEGERGGVRFLVPEVPFNAYVGAHGYHTLTLGPFEPASPPERLEVELERSGGVAGQVFADGEPAAGARLHAHRTVPEGLGAFTGGFYTRCVMDELSSAVSGDDGAFELPLWYGGDFWVHAELDGFGRGSAGPFPFTRGERIEAVRLDLSRAGAIEGSVRTGAGVDPRGTRIAASSGDGHVELVAARADGSYRFEGLAAGDWQVERIADDLVTYLEGGSVDELESGDVPAWPVAVRAGETTRHDVDLSDELPAVLRVRWGLSGPPHEDWSIWVDDTRMLPDAEGRFEFTTRAPAEVVLGAYASRPRSHRAMLWGRIAVDEPLVELEVDFEVGTLELLELDAGGAWALVWRGDALRWEATLLPTAEGRARVEAVPAGTVTLRRDDEDVLEIELGAGEAKSVTAE